MARCHNGYSSNYNFWIGMGFPSKFGEALIQSRVDFLCGFVR